MSPDVKAFNSRQGWATPSGGTLWKWFKTWCNYIHVNPLYKKLEIQNYSL